MGLFDRKKKTDLSASTACAASAPKKRVSKPRFIKQALSAEEFKAWKNSSTASVSLDSSFINDRARFMKAYFAMVTRYVPAAKTAVWVWRNLSFTESKVKLIGGTVSERIRAQEELSILSGHIYPDPSSKSDGMHRLLSAWYTNVFRYGRFSGRLILNNSLDGVKEFELLDAFSVFFKKKSNIAFYDDGGNMGVPLNPLSFYYYGLDSDSDNPYGIALMESAQTLMEIANEMIEDMRYSSSNAGIPRLHIKIKQPPILENEDEDTYAGRIRSYFNNTIAEMDELAPDDNIYTWSDVEIGTTGGASASNFVWKMNLQIIQEEIISAFHLYPWVFGKSFGTTKNWVTAQFDVLMQMISSLHSEAADFASWISNTHLQLKGLGNVKVSRSFLPPRDPAAKDMAVAEKIRLENTKMKMDLGFIDQAAAAREHGYETAEK